MVTGYIDITPSNIDKEHICCAFSDKKCAAGYMLKKDWMKGGFGSGFVLRRLDERAKVFIEYSPAETSWVPVDAPGYLFIGCMWVSGKYKSKGHAKALLDSVEKDAAAQGKKGLVTVVGEKKFHFMGDGQWFRAHGFEVVQKLPSGFVLLAKKLEKDAPDPVFRESAKEGLPAGNEGIVVYYSDRCPYTDYYVNESLKETMEKRGLKYRAVKLETLEQAKECPSPATVFSLFKDGKFITTDLSVCVDSRFDRIINK